jgi:MscS family membrane protein
LAGAVGIAYRILLPRLKNNKTIWDEMLLRAFYKPVEYFIWTLGLTIVGDIVAIAIHQPTIFRFIDPLRKLLVVFLLVWALIRFVTEAELHYLAAHHKKVDRTTVNALGKIAKATLVVLGVLVALQSMGIGISGVLAFGGIGGAAVAFSAKDLLANFFGGLIIYLDRPFAVGDWIRSPDRDIEGTVEYIGWRLCRIRTFDKRPLYVPNAIFTSISIENPSRMSNRRIDTVIGLRYEDADKMPGILQKVEAMLRSHEGIDTNQTLMVNFVNFGASALEFNVYCFTKTIEWTKFQAVQQDIFFQIIRIITEQGAECAFPSTTVYVPDGLQLKQQQEEISHV